MEGSIEIPEAGTACPLPTLLTDARAIPREGNRAHACASPI